MDKLPEQVWETYFARPDGEIPKMSAKLTDLCLKVSSIETKIDKLNGHDTAIKDLDKRVDDQEEFCKLKQVSEKTMNETLDKVREQERNRTLKFVAVGGFGVAGLSLFFRLLGII